MAMKSCVICGKNFDSQGDTCLSCLLKPSRETSIDIKQSHVGRNLKEDESSKQDDSLKENRISTGDANLTDDKSTNETKISKENTVNSLTTKERACIDCGKMYAPTGNCQKRCPDCGDKYAKNYKKISNSKSNAARSKAISKPTVAPVANAPETKPETKPRSHFIEHEHTHIPEIVITKEGVAPKTKWEQIEGVLTKSTEFNPKVITVEIGNLKITISQ